MSRAPDLHRARLITLYRVIPASEAVDVVRKRVRELLRVWLERLDARLAGVRPDELMRWMPSPRG